MNEIIYPELYCPFPYQINKNVELLEDYALKWVLRFNLLTNESIYQRFCKTKVFLLSAGVYPHYQIEELKIGNDWLSWLFIWDDYCELSELKNKPEVLKVFHQRFMEIFRGAELTSKDVPISRALSDLRQRMLQVWGAKCFHLLVPCLENYFHGYVLEATNQSYNRIPDLDTYIKTRRLSIAGDLVLAWIEYFNQLMIPNFLRKHDLKIINKIAIDILAWCNDIFSFPNKLASSDVHNLVLVLHYQQELSLDKALKRAVEMHNEEVSSLLSLEVSIPSFGKEVNAEIAKYISGIHEWIYGNFYWASHTARYH